jgi:hypothetical protein
MLIKQGKDKGLNLSTAIEAARKFKEEQGERARRLPVDSPS